MQQDILIVGATGVIGAPITKAIISAKTSFRRIAILTSSATVTNKASEIGSLKSQGVEILIGDLSREQDVKNAYDGGPPFPLFSSLLLPSQLTPPLYRNRYCNLLRWPERHTYPNVPSYNGPPRPTSLASFLPNMAQTSNMAPIRRTKSPTN